VRARLEDLIAAGRPILADGATGTNYFAEGLTSGEPPEFWLEAHPERVRGLHQRFVDAGADVILTDSFGANARRLALHAAAHRARELSRLAASIAREVADAAPRPVVVAGSVGPTGDLFAPLGVLTHADAVATFTDQILGLRDGGADVAWIETMSAPEEVRAAAEAAIACDMPYVATCSFDTAGRTMMGLAPVTLAEVFEGLGAAPLAIGANCGVGASDLLVSVLEISRGAGTVPVVAKGNCGIPRFEGTTITYSGTPALMARYAEMALDAGARIVGGCCGTTPEHLAGMRHAIDAHSAGPAPTLEDVVREIGPLTNSAPSASEPRAPSEDGRRRRVGRRGAR
jgi:5-methyltetrahydrofolate--homocysteine methyltransferase